MAVEYKSIYRVEFCEQKNFQTVIVLFKRRMDSSSATPTVIDVYPVGVNDSPVVVNYPDIGVYKMNQINGSECEFNLVSSPVFDLKSMYTADETEWLVEISGAWTWTGFIIPDSCSEPFLQHPYPVRIRAVDRLGILKDIPYINKTVLYKGFETDLTIIARVLAFTDIKLDIISAVNTTEQTMNANDPLTQVYIDNDRFHDIDGNPFTCEVVLKSILDRWGAQLHQFNGAWQIVNVLEKSRGIVPARRFNYLGAFISNTTIGNDIQGGGEGRTIRPVGSTEIAKALASSTSYYQYGYPANKLFNGDFNIWSPPMTLPQGWSSSGGAIGSVGSVAENPDDKYLIIINTDPANSAIISDSAVQVRSTDSVSISFDLFAPTATSGGFTGTASIRVAIFDQFGNFFTKNGWARGGFYEIRTNRIEFINQMSIRFDVDDRPEDYQLKIGFRTVITDNNGIERETYINNAEIRVSLKTNQTKAPLGSYNRQRSLSSQTATKDPILILHSDEANRQRTSRLLINNLDPDPFTLRWKRAGYTENISLLQTISNTELTLHQRPYEIFEADFFGYGTIGLNSRLSVDLIPDVMIFLSGSFNVMSGVHSLRFAQILIDKLDNTKVAGFDQMFEDYGGLTDKSGLSVGSPSSVSPGGGGATIDTNGFIRNQTEYQTDAKYNVSVGIIKDKLIIPAVVPGGLIAGQVAVWASNLSGISNNPSGYVLPVASASILGGVKIGAGLTMTGEFLSASGGESPLNFLSPLVRNGNNVTLQTGIALNNDILGNSNTSTMWGGWSANFSQTPVALSYLVGGHEGVARPYSADMVNLWLGTPTGFSLQQVTERGNTTSLSIIANGGFVIGASSATSKGFSLNKTFTSMNQHSFEDYSFLNPTAGNEGWGVFDSSTSLGGSANNDHIISFQARTNYSGTGVLGGNNAIGSVGSNSGMFGMLTAMTHSSIGTINNTAGILINDIVGTGAINNNYGIYIRPITKGLLKSYSIYSAGGKSFFEGKVYIGSDVDNGVIAKMQVNGDIYAYNFLGTSTNTVNWGGFPANFATNPTSIDVFAAFDGATNTFRSANKVQSQGFLNINDGTLLNNGITGNSATATKLQTVRTIWGQSFDGSGNIIGSLTSVTDITASGKVKSSIVEAIDAQIIPQVAPSNFESGKSYLWIGNLSGITN